MSLFDFIRQPDVKAKFKAEFPKPKLTVTKEPLAPSLTKNPQLIGVAFDYLLRFYIQHLNPHANTRGWVAESSVALLSRNPKLQDLCNECCKIIDAAKIHHATFLENGVLTDDLLRHTLLLAKIDSFRRARVIDINLHQINPQDIQDLRNLIAVVDPNQFKTSAPIFLNPVFGMASAMLGGADADLIIGDLLIDVKTIKNFELDLDSFHQLVAYFTLSVLNGSYERGQHDYYHIKRVGIYFSRYGHLHTMNIEDIVDAARFPEFLKWFENRARGKAA